MVRRLLLLLALLGSVSVPAAAQDTVRIATASFPPSLGNPYMALGVPSSIVWSAMFDGLTRLDAEGRIAPSLATEWELLETNRWRLRLREGVAFSNGEAFDAAAAKASFDWLASEAARGSIVAGEMRVIEAVEVIDPLTVDFVTNRPDPILPNRLSAAMIVAPDAWARLGPDGFAQRPVGTGSFTIADMAAEPGRVVAEAWRESWRPPIIDRLMLIELPDSSARLQALLSGQVDMINTVSPDSIGLVEARGFETVITPAASVLSLAFRTTQEGDSPIKDVRVRRALNLAIDPGLIAEVVMLGTTQATGQGVMEGTPGYNPEVETFPYDPEAARALLAEAGYPDGVDLTATVVAGEIPVGPALFQAIAQQLAQAGIRLELRNTTFADWLRRYLTGGMTTDLFNLSWNAAPYNDPIRALEYFSCLKPHAHFCAEEMVPRIEAAAREMDPGRREAMLQALVKEYHDRAVALFLTEQRDIAAHAPRLRDVHIAARVVDYHRLRIGEE